jgi:hypothetical protein
MKSVLRNPALAITALATITLSLSACSGAEDTELLTSDSVGSDNAAQASAGSPEKPEAATGTEAKARTEQGESVPRVRGQKPATSSANEPADPAHDDENAETDAQPELEGENVDDVQVADEPAADAPAAVHSNTMHVSGRQLFDACGQPFVVRGVEQILGNQLPEGNDWLGLVREIASTGVNSVRILPGVNTLSLDDIDQILTFIGEQNLVAFLAPLGQGNEWYARDDVKAMLKKHESFIIIDAYGEPQYDDIERWRTESKAALAEFRALGYEVPLTVTANQFGRALPSLFDYGAEILAADPLHNTFLGWQAYWGNTGYYQDFYGYSLDEAVDAIVASDLPIQMGLDHITDMPSTEADYGTLMRGAQENGIGWLWWDFYNPYGAENNLSEDGTADNLTYTGGIVLESHDASIASTAQRACGH